MRQKIQITWSIREKPRKKVCVLEHHLPDGGGDSLPRAVVPDELGVLVCPLEDVHCCLRVVPHGVHEHTRQETHQSQPHLRGRDEVEREREGQKRWDRD